MLFPFPRLSTFIYMYMLSQYTDCDCAMSYFPELLPAVTLLPSSVPPLKPLLREKVIIVTI